MIKDDRGVLPLIPILILILIIPIVFIALALFFLKFLIIGILILVALLILIAVLTGRIKLAQKQSFAVIIIVIILVLMAVGTGLLFGITPIDIDTDTVSIGVDSGEGVFGKGFGTYGGGSCFDVLTEGELFDKEAYAVSWKPGVESETINMQGCIFSITLPPKRIDDIKYKLYWSDDGSNWGDPIEVWEKGTDLRPDAVQYSFFENKPNSAIRVELTGDGWGGIFGDWKAFDDAVFAYDQAYIYSGVGNIEILNENKIVAVGEDLLIDVEKLGYSAGRGWTLELFSFPQNRIVKTWSLNDGDVGVQTYLVTSSDFVAWASCDDNQSSIPNRLEARLFNNLWKQDEADADTIDIRANAPPQPIVTTDKDWYNVNDIVTISIEGIRNENTNLSLCYFLIDVYYQPGLIQIDDDTRVDAFMDDATYTTDPLPQSGTIRVEVTAYDEGGHPSGHTILQKTVKLPDEGCNPLIEECGNGDIAGIPWIWIIVIIAVIFALVGVFILTKKGRK